MEMTASVVITLVALLIALSATYNAYLLKGGKLALSQVFVALGMIVLIFSQIMGKGLPSDLLFGAGLVLLLLSSWRLRSSLK